LKTKTTQSVSIDHPISAFILVEKPIYGRKTGRRRQKVYHNRAKTAAVARNTPTVGPTVTTVRSFH